MLIIVNALQKSPAVATVVAVAAAVAAAVVAVAVTAAVSPSGLVKASIVAALLFSCLDHFSFCFTDVRREGEEFYRRPLSQEYRASITSKIQKLLPSFVIYPGPSCSFLYRVRCSDISVYVYCCNEVICTNTLIHYSNKVGVVKAFSWRASIWGDAWTIHSPPAL